MKKIYLLFIVVLFLQTTHLFAQFNSIEFDGDGDYIATNSSIDLSGSAITLEAWIYVDEFQAASPYISSVIGIDNGGSFAFLRLGDSGLGNNKLQFVLQIGWFSASTKLDGINELSTYTWYHVAATYDGASMKIYINGDLEASKPQTGTFGANSILTTGNSESNANRYLDGKVDEVRAWNVARTQSQIQANMTMELASDDRSGLQLYYQMTDGSGTSVTDNSANSYTGTLYGNAAWDNGPISVLPSGDGTSGSPYQIASIENLFWLTQNSNSWSSYFEQTADIDASITSDWEWGQGFSPLGNDASNFQGFYDGKYYKIDGLYINRVDKAAFIARGENLTIKNLGLTNVDITGTRNAGSFGAYLSVSSGGATIIENCYSTGSISSSYNTANIGGFAGGVEGVTIRNCYSMANVTFTGTTTSGRIGAFVGGTGNTTIENSYCTGSVTYTQLSNPSDKGFVGVGATSTYSSNYFDSDVSNQTTATGATAKTSSEMKTQGTFVGWDFLGETTNGNNDYWDIYTSLNTGYPYLTGSMETPMNITTQTVTVITGVSAIGNGNIIDLGYPLPDLTAYGVCWNTTGTPTISDNKTNEGIPTTTGAFNSLITGLEMETTYYVRAYTSSSSDTVYGNEESFTTLFQGSVPSGSGSETDPYRIATLGNLLWVAEQCNGGNNFYEKYFIQTANIDASGTTGWYSGAGWEPIGNNTLLDYYFEGSYDGMGYIIDGLYINRSSEDNVGLFSLVRYGIIKNVGLTNIDFTGKDNAGGISSVVNVNASVTNCFTTGTLNANTKGGGLIGSTGASTISNSYSLVTVTTSLNMAGGLIGYAVVDNTISNCYTSSTVTSNAYVGGFIGYRSVSNITISNSFWNSELLAAGVGSGGEDGLSGETTINLKTENTFTNAGWDFAGDENGAEDIWTMSEIGSYPYFYKALSSITTQAVDDISYASATGNGIITNIGSPAVHDHGVCWNTTGSPTIYDERTNNNTAYATGAFTTSITGLEFETTYYVRAYATTVSGTSYGEEVIFTTDNGDITWDGSEGTSWASVLNWSDGLPSIENNAIIPGGLSNYPILASGNLATCKGLSVASGASLTIESGGSLITHGSITNEGTIEVKKDISQGAWHLISVPNNTTTANAFTGDYLQSWDEVTAEWSNISDISTPLSPVTGYGLWTDGSGSSSYSFSGIPNTGDQNQTITLSEVAGTDNDGANLLGNPYPSPIAWGLLDDTWGAVYYWDPSENAGAGDYIEWNNGTGSGSQYIPPMQGFFIVVNESNTTGGSGTFALNNTHRTHSGRTTYYKSKISNGIVLEALSGESSDELFIRFEDEANNGFDFKYDALKFFSGVAGISQIYTISEDQNLAIDVRSEQESIQLGYQNETAGIYAIEAKEITDLAEATLEDTKTNTFHNLSKGSYEFVWDVTDDEKRFKLHINAVGIEETQISENKILIYAADDYIFIKGANGFVETHGRVSLLTVSDVMGKIVLEKELSGSALSTIPVNLQTGVYVVIVRSGNEINTEKVFIK